jgi:prepilin-type N-terminal cleavage/methylation domain-containing protein
MGRKGLTLIELLVGLSLLAVFSTAVVGLLVQGQRSYQQQVERVQVQAHLRTGIAIIAAELRELGSSDSAGPDLLEMKPSSVTYRAMRSTHFLCATPGPASGDLVVWKVPSYELRQLEPGRDSLLILAENNPTLESDNAWRTAAVTSVHQGLFCPGPAEGLRISVVGAVLAGVEGGAPVRAFQVTRMLLYGDRSGQHWLGLREWRAASGWSTTQPVVGPVAANGLRLSYLDARGETTTSPERVALIGITFAGVGERRWIPLAGSRGLVRDSLTTYVTLRNRRRGESP